MTATQGTQTLTIFFPNNIDSYITLVLFDYFIDKITKVYILI